MRKNILKKLYWETIEREKKNANSFFFWNFSSIVIFTSLYFVDDAAAAAYLFLCAAAAHTHKTKNNRDRDKSSPFRICSIVIFTSLFFG